MDFGINADFTVPGEGTHEAAFREARRKGADALKRLTAVCSRALPG